MQAAARSAGHAESSCRTCLVLLLIYGAWVLGASLWDDTGRGPDGKIDDRILSDSTGSYGKNSSVMDIIFFFLKIPSR